MCHCAELPVSRSLIKLQCPVTCGTKLHIFLLNGQTYVNVTHLLLIGPDRLAIILREQHVTVVMVSFCLSLTLSVSLPTAPPPSFQFHSSTHLLLIQAITLL